MTDKTQPEALALADEARQPMAPDVFNLWAAEAAGMIRRQHARIAELKARVQELGAMARENRSRRIVELEAQLEALRAALAASPTPPAEQQAAPKAAPGDALDEALRERDDAEDFIDATLDEVLGHERPEWSSSYGRADALNDVQERMTALHKPAVDKAWDRFQSTKAAPGEQYDHQILAITTAYEQGVGKGLQAYGSGKEIANPYDTGYRCDLAWQYGYKEGKEQAERIAKAAPQPAPAPLSDEAVRDAAFEAVRKKLCALPRYSFVLDDDGLVRRVQDRTGNWIEFDAAHELFDPVAVDAALAAQGEKT